MTWPAALLWVLIIIGALSRGPMIIYLFSGTIIFGALTLLPSELTGGLNLPAQIVCAAVLIGKVFISAENRAIGLNLAQDVRKLGLLAIFGIYAALTSLLLPRLFAGDVMVFSLNAAASQSPLAPTSANFTQTVYLLVSLGITFSFAVAARSPMFMQQYIRSVLLAGVLLVASGVLNAVVNAAGQPALLDAFHNASYATLSDVSIAGQQRVVGLMPEASVYGEMCCLVLSFILFNYRVFEPVLRKRVVPLTIISLVVITVLSTASTGYVGLIVIAAVQAIRVVGRFLLVSFRSVSPAKSLLFVLSAVIIGGIGVSLIPSATVAHYQDLINVLLFQKTSSSSYIERSSWTAAGVNAFFVTHGVGIGVGSIRTSNWFVNITASTGVIGVGLIILFVMNLLSPLQKYAAPDMKAFARGLKLCLIPAGAMIGISGTTPDPGVWIMSIFGLLFALRLMPQPISAPASSSTRKIPHAGMAQPQR